MKTLLMLAVVMLAGACGSTVHYEPELDVFAQAREPWQIDVFFAEPISNYHTLGNVYWDYFRPHERDAVLADALPELKAEAAAAGGDAIIIRWNRRLRPDQREIYIRAEVIRFVDR